MSGKPAARANIDVHPEGTILDGSHDVHINRHRAARLGDLVEYGEGTTNIAQTVASVLINGKPAARLGDPLTMGDNILTGSHNVMIGSLDAITSSICAKSETQVGATLSIHKWEPRSSMGFRILTSFSPGRCLLYCKEFLTVMSMPSTELLAGPLGTTGAF